MKFRLEAEEEYGDGGKWLGGGVGGSLGKEISSYQNRSVLNRPNSRQTKAKAFTLVPCLESKRKQERG